MSIVSEASDGVKCVEFSEVIKIDEGKLRQHGQRVEPEDLCADRGVAEPADRGRATLPVFGRDLAEADVG
jgi:hypothetical protein